MTLLEFEFRQILTGCLHVFTIGLLDGCGCLLLFGRNGLRRDTLLKLA